MSFYCWNCKLGRFDVMSSFLLESKRTSGEPLLFLIQGERAAALM